MHAPVSRLGLMFAALLALFVGPAVAGSLDEANEQTRQLLRKTMQERRIPGLQIAVVQDDRLVLSEAYGLSQVENKVAATTQTLFPLNSATKSFTGVAVMQLAEAGQVDLQAPLSRYLDDLPPAWQQVRVRQLLAHTSGLPDIVDEPGPVTGATEADMWKAVKQRPVLAPAGECFAYNQTNYGLLAQIIVKQGGKPYERFMAERQFAVAGMRQASFGDSYDLLPNAATIYSYFPRRTLAQDDGNRLSRWIYDIPYSLNAGGGLQTTAEDVARWLLALSTGRLIKPASVQAMWQPERLNDGSSGPWSAGWPVLATTPQRQLAGIGGNRSAFIVYPDQRLAIVVLTNLVGGNPERFIPQIAALYKASDRQR
ncbi:serine hydrolase domain-containing protein [Pelomonas sp. SE-A7]|uniref:serine hydrolase domain-containing protein n=1 Tax=Pelomonas sp. SE-A7 TaxID=3054953 RepID=UPI00259C96EF|nr:serine hydrolase domain-containing protein [Pelomonas sp. SE-A7]MDM4765904.1 serine hydrolase domain-containing protein [Pelomonas sp. SE-A7]